MATKGSVSEYIERQPEPQREIFGRLREIILTACPEIEERMKLGVPYYDDRVYILSLKYHVNLGLSIQGLCDQDLIFLKGTGKTFRCLEIRSLDDIDEPMIVILLDKVRHKEKGRYERHYSNDTDRHTLKTLHDFCHPRSGNQAH